MQNYKQALQLQAELRPKLEKAKQQLGIASSDVFEEMRLDELEFLSKRQQGAFSDTEQREVQYVKTLERSEQCR